MTLNSSGDSGKSMRSFFDHARVSLKPRPFGATGAARPLRQEVVAMKKRTVSQSEQTLQLLILEILGHTK